MSDRRILFGDFEFPRMGGIEYLMDEKSPVTDYLFVSDRSDCFSMYFENGFPIFTVPENSDRPYCLFEMKSPDRMIKFFCPEKHPNLDSVVWYFYVEVFDDKGVTHVLPGQVRVGIDEFQSKLAKGKPKFIEVLEEIKLHKKSMTS